jgi:transcriptional regulator with XRE-family HTH domain
MPFGGFVRNRRIEMGIGLNDISGRLSVSPAYWSRVERELENPPRDELIEKTAAILGMRLDDLFIEAERFPPDMQRDVGKVVRAYRRFRSIDERQK